MSNIQHSSRSDRWFTPRYIIDMVHEVIPHIDLDPCSEESANEIVQASRYITKEEDGLAVNWAKYPVTVFLNSPGGKAGNKSMSALFWQRLIDLRDEGLLIDAIFMGFSLEHLAVTQNCSESLCNFPICIPRRRIKFVSPEGTYNCPTHSNVVAYIPGLVNETQRFKEVFSEIGAIMYPDMPAKN
jgi:hypothetical protein